MLTISCSNKKEQSSNTENTFQRNLIKEWEDSISKEDVTLSFQGITVGKTKRSEDMFWKQISLKYINPDNFEETEDYVFYRYSTFKGIVYEITIDTNNHDLANFMIDTYKERYGFPKDSIDVEVDTFHFKKSEISISGQSNYGYSYNPATQKYKLDKYVADNVYYNGKSDSTFRFTYTFLPLKEEKDNSIKLEIEKAARKDNIEAEKERRRADSLRPKLKNQF